MIEKTIFGKTPDGQSVDLYTLTNSHGVEVRVMNYGGIVVSIRVPDKTGKLDDVVLGFDSFAGYLDNKHISARSSGGTEIGLPARNSPWMASPTTWPRTTAPIPCTAA